MTPALFFDSFIPLELALQARKLVIKKPN